VAPVTEFQTSEIDWPLTADANRPVGTLVNVVIEADAEVAEFTVEFAVLVLE
jgi:hypothetical protein